MDPSVLVGCSEPALGISMLAQGFSFLISYIFVETSLIHDATLKVDPVTQWPLFKMHIS